MPHTAQQRPARTRRSKPFRDITLDDVVTALFDVDDIQDVLRAHWDEIFIDPDTEEELPTPPMRRNALTPGQWEMVTRYFADGFEQAKRCLVPIAAEPAITVSRRLNRLSDLAAPLGVHWSAGDTPPKGTEDYGQHTVTAVVAAKDVDWVTTTARAMFWWGPEREVSIAAGANVRLSCMTFGNNAIATA